MSSIREQLLAEVQWLLYGTSEYKGTTYGVNPKCFEEGYQLTFDEAEEMLKAPHVQQKVRDAFRDYKMFRNKRTEARFYLVLAEAMAEREATQKRLDDEDFKKLLAKFSEQLSEDNPEEQKYIREQLAISGDL